MYELALFGSNYKLPVLVSYHQSSHIAVTINGTVPPDLLRGVVITLLKGKGDQWDRSNHRDITLLSIQVIV